MDGRPMYWKVLALGFLRKHSEVSVLVLMAVCKLASKTPAFWIASRES